MTAFLAILAGLLAAGFSVAVYVVLQAVVGRFIGATVETISIGLGPVIFRRVVFGSELVISAIPLGGYTKFFGQDDFEIPELTTASGDARRRFADTSISGRALLLLVGPISNVLLGVGMICLPVALSAPQLSAEGLGVQITPVSAPSIGVLQSPSTLHGQWRFVEGTAIRFWTSMPDALRNDQWGGPTSWMYSAWVVGRKSPPGWLTCMGLLIGVVGVLNLLPIPILNGGHLVLLMVEAIGGKVNMETVQKLHLAGLLLTLAFFGMTVYLDLRWWF